MPNTPRPQRTKAEHNAMGVFSYKSSYFPSGIVAIMLAAGGWFVASKSSWQEYLTEERLALSGPSAPSSLTCGSDQDRGSIASTCFSEVSRTSRQESYRTAQYPEGVMAETDVFDPHGDTLSPESSQPIDIYDPSTWPVDPSVSAELSDIVPIDLYDPATWPVEINQGDDLAAVEPMDLYEPDTWPSNAAKRIESVSSAGEEVDVYDSATWPQTIGTAASGDAIVPIDPYDAHTWPKK